MVTTLALLVLGAGCATRGPTHLYLAGAGSLPIIDRDLGGDAHAELTGFLAAGDWVVGLGYEFNTDYVWLRLAPGDRLVTIKRSVRRVWYRYRLPAEFAARGRGSLDLAVRAFNRTVYAAMAEPGVVGKVTRYGEVLPAVHPGGEAERRVIGGLAWDQERDRLVVLYADGEIVTYRDEVEVAERLRLSEPVEATTLAYDSNRQRYFVPLAGARELGEFDATGRLIDRRPLRPDVRAIDAGQRSAVRVF
jgi:hypothetical protein